MGAIDNLCRVILRLRPNILSLRRDMKITCFCYKDTDGRYLVDAFTNDEDFNPEDYEDIKPYTRVIPDKMISNRIDQTLNDPEVFFQYASDQVSYKKLVLFAWERKNHVNSNTLDEIYEAVKADAWNDLIAHYVNEFKAAVRKQLPADTEKIQLQCCVCQKIFDVEVELDEDGDPVLDDLDDIECPGYLGQNPHESVLCGSNNLIVLYDDLTE